MKLNMTDEEYLALVRRISQFTPLNYVQSSVTSYMIVVHKVDISDPQSNKRLKSACKTVINERKLLQLIG